MVLTDYTTTGDGLIAALQVLAAVVENGGDTAETCRMFEPWPQLLQNVRFNGGDPLGADRVKAVIAVGEARLGAEGRLLIRKSGTEPLIRVMGEGRDEALVREIVEGVCEEVAAA